MSDRPPRPDPLPVRYDPIPTKLRDREQWVCWRYKWDDGRDEWTKVPLDVEGSGFASSTDAGTWTAFEAAKEYHEREGTDTDGIGFVAAADDLFLGVDLDDCRDPETGEVEEWAADLLADVPTYGEVSPSGTGFRQFALAILPDGGTRADVDDADGHLEMYDEGRYLTVTGHHVDDTPQEVQQVNDAVRDVHAEYISDDPAAEQQQPDRGAGGADPADLPDDGGADLSDGEVVEKAKNAENGAKFTRLWNGRTSGYESHSEADAALCALLAFWTGGDRRQIDRLFRDSGLYRDKWDEDRGSQTYGELTIDGALGEVSDYYSPGGADDPPEPAIPPADADADTSGEQEQPADHGTGDTATPSWVTVQEKYEEDRGLGRYHAADALEARTDWMYVRETETLWVYDADSGTFNQWGEEYAAKVLEANLGAHYSTSEKREVVDRLQARNQTSRSNLNAREYDEYLVCVGNGVLNVETGELYDHSPEYRFIRGLSVDWDPDAVPERTLRFLRGVTKRDADMWTLLQQLGQGLLPGYPFRAFMLLYGPGKNGKSALTSVFRALVGDENAASVELAEFDEDDFATSDLPGKMINIGSDLSGRKIKDVSMLKKLTSNEDTVRANEKYEKTFDFQNEAAMFFAGNEPPVFAERTDALKDRLYPVHMPYQFTSKDDGNPDKDPRIATRITSDGEEMRGLLTLAVQGAQELIETDGEFAMPEGPEERMKRYEAASDPIRRFVMNCLDPGDGTDVLLKDDVYDVYSHFCRENDARSATENVFKGEISQQALVDVEKSYTRQYVDGEGRAPCWKYVQFSDDAREYMPARLQERYFGAADGDGGSGDDPDGEQDPDRDADGTDPAGPTPLAEVATDPLPYPTVTAEVADVERGIGNLAFKAALVDETASLDLVVYDEDMAAAVAQIVEPGACVRLENVTVSEYEGDTQLELDSRATVAPIQQGAGYTPAPDPDDGTLRLSAVGTDDGDGDDLQAVADGGAQQAQPTDGDADDCSGAQAAASADDSAAGDEADASLDDTTDDASGPAANADRLTRALAENGHEMQKAALFGALDLPPEQADYALQKAQERGDVRHFEDSGLVRYLGS